MADTSKKEQVRRLVTQWFRQRAESIFHDRFDVWVEKAERHGIQAETFQIHRMKNRWGSCTDRGTTFSSIPI